MKFDEGTHIHTNLGFVLAVMGILGTGLVYIVSLKTTVDADTADIASFKPQVAQIPAISQAVSDQKDEIDKIYSALLPASHRPSSFDSKTQAFASSISSTVTIANFNH